MSRFLARAVVGVVMLLDAESKPFDRAWCNLESHTVLQHREGDQGKRLGILAMIPEDSEQYWIEGKTGERHVIDSGPALRMDLGNGQNEDRVKPHNGRFPLVVAIKGTKTRVRGAQAMEEDDLNKILRWVAGIPEESAAAPPEECDEYVQFDRQLAAHAVSRTGPVQPGAPREGAGDAGTTERSGTGLRAVR